MVTLKHLAIATLLIAYTYLIMSVFDLEDNVRTALAIFKYSNGWRAWSL